MPIRVPVEQTGLERSIQNAAKSAGRNLKINLGTNARDIKSLEQPLGRITGQADEFTKSMEAANARVLAFGASVGIINSVVQSFKSLVSTTVEVEKSLAKINSILQTSVTGLDSLKKQIFDIARGTEQTFDTVAEAALELSRQGLSATEVTKRLNDSLILSRLSGISAAEAVSGLTAAVNSFTKAGLTTGEVLNKISNAANQFAVSERDLIEGFKRSASVAELAGVSIDELGGIITAVQQKTARGGAVIGNSFKTIFTRIGRSENLDLLRGLGIQITDVQGKILPATKLIENLAKEIENLGDVEVREITQKIGGGFQIAPLLAALSDYSSQNSIAIQATQAFASASDQAYKKNEALNQTLSAAINRTTLSVKELANTLGELGVTDTFKTLLDFFNNLASGAEKILDGEGLGGKFARGIVKGLGTALIQGGLALFGVLILKLSGQLAKFGLESVKTFFNLNKEAKKVQATQQQIVSTLLSDRNIRDQILKIENSSVSVEQKRAQQAEFFNTALQKQLSTLNQINTISAGIASPIARATSGRGVRRGASGYLPVGAEQKDIDSGVGGAPRGSKPVVIPNFAFGGGKKGTMVANNSEYIVPNFAGGGSAIFNQDMVKSMGLPSGAKKINAAGGYIPNFAKKTADQTNFDSWMKSNYPKAIKGGRWSEKSFESAYGAKTGITGADASLKNLYSRSNIFSKKWSGYGQSEKQTLAIQASQKKALSEKGKATSYGVLFPDAEGGARSKNISVGGGYSIKAVPISTDPPNALYKKIRKDLVEGSVDYASNIGLTPDVLKDPIFKKRVNESLNEGSVRSAFGTVFESAFQASLGKPIGKSNEVWDLDQKRGEISSLVGSFQKTGLLARSVGPQISELAAADFKNTLSEGNVKSLQLKIQRTEKGSKASRGYIPNYANGGALEEAIQREKDAGVPINQIRVNQDGKLRSSQNPNGLAVTNTRDEPTGAIPRNAATGYTPNFQQRYPAGTKIDGKSVGGRFVNQEGLDKLNKSADGASKSIDKTSKSSTDAAGKLFGISAISFGLQSAFGGLADEADGVTKGFLEITQGITQGVTTLTALQSLGVAPGFGFGVKKGGFGRNVTAGGLTQLRTGKRQLKSGSVVKNPGGFLAGIGRVSAGGAKFGIGKVLATFGRFIPILGSAVVGFQLLNPILKKFGIDLASIGGKFFKSIGQALNLIDTPAEKSAKALESFADRVEKTLAGGGQTNIIQQRLNELQAQRSGVDTKGKSQEEIAAEVRAKQTADITKVFGTNQKTGLGAVLGLEDLTQIAKVTVAGTQFGGGKTQGFSQDKEVERFTVDGETVDRKTLNAVDKNLSAAQRVLSAQLYNLIDPKLLKGIDQSTTEGKNKIQELLAEKSKEIFGDEKSKKALQEALKRFVGQLRIDGPAGAPRAEESLIKSFLNIDSFKSATSNLDAGETKLVEEEVKRVKLEILEIERKSNLERVKALTSIKSQTQFALELKAASKDTSDAQRSDIAEQVRGLEAQKKLSQDLADSFAKRIQDSATISRFATVNANKEVDPKKYAQINKALLETNSLISQGVIGEKDITKELNKRLKPIIEAENLREELIGSITAEQKAITAASRIDQARNELAKARLDILKAQATEEARAQRNRERALKSTRSSEDLDLEKRRLLLQEKRLKLEGGTIGKSDRGSLQNRKAIENIRIDEAKINTEQVVRDAIRGFQDELLRDVQSSPLSGGDKRQLEREITSAKTEDQIVAITGRAEKAIIDAEKEFEQRAKARQDQALSILGREEANVDYFKRVVDTFNQGVENLTGLSTDVLSPRGQEPQQANNGLLNPANVPEPVDFAKAISSYFTQSKPSYQATASQIQSETRKGQVSAQLSKIKENANIKENNAAKEAANATNNLTEALKNFSNIAKGAIQGLSDSLAQSQFDAFTSADPSSIQSSIIGIRGVGVAREALEEGDSNEDAERKRLEFIALETKRAEIRKATSTATRVDLEFELEKTIKILAIRNKQRELLRSGGSDEQLQALQREIEAEEKATQGISDRIKKIAITGDEAIERIKEEFSSGADQFVSSLSSGLVDAISKGESLGDVLRSAALDFTSRMAKVGLDNVFRQTIGSFIPGFAEGGMITGGSGNKDDVPAVLMGGEYVMKKSAVQKYGPNFMNALNSGRIEGYNQGGMVRTESGTQSSSWTPRSDKTEERDGYRKPSGDVRTDSGIIASSWTREASYLNSKKSELEKGLDYRSDSGIFVSRWTPQSAYEGKEDFEKEYFPEEDQEVRAESGITVSRWTKEASEPNKAKEPSKSGRTESGLESSKWTVGASQENSTRIEKSPFVTGRVESGVPVSRWKPEAQPFEATNTQSFGKTIAVDFLNEVKQNSSKVVPDALSSSVPAMTMGGEFLLNKKSVAKYGPEFLDQVNQGKVQKFAAGGLVQADIFGNKRDENFKYKRQTGENTDYFAPGLYDSGNITGAGDLLDFATQSFTSGKKDYISSPSAGAAVVALEPESVRLTNFGRSRDTPLQQATRDAKNQAFELNIGYQRDYFEYLKRREAEKKAAKAQRKAMLTQIGIGLVTAGLSAGISGAGNAIKGAEALKGSALTGLQKFTAGAKGFFTGGSLPGIEGNRGGIFNAFSKKGYQSFDMSKYVGNRSALDPNFISNNPYLAQMGVRNASKAIGFGENDLYDNLQNNSYQGGGGSSSFIRRKATGGYIPNGTGIDDVPAMLTGGEFVLNSAATQRIGQENLEVANAGGEQGLGESSEELIEKLEELIDVTRENAGEINITVTGGSGSSGGGNNSSSASSDKTESSGQMEDNKARQELAKQIKEKVLEVIRDEKRLGGSLRN